jgi:hypothetical protein
MKMPQLLTGTSMPFTPFDRLLPMLASHHSTQIKSPVVRVFIWFVISFIFYLPFVSWRLLIET